MSIRRNQFNLLSITSLGIFLFLLGCQSSLPDTKGTPTAARILFTSTRDGQSAPYLMDKDGSNVQVVSFSALTDYVLKQFNWVPSLNAYIAVLRDPSGQYDLFLLDANGKIMQRITNDVTEEGLAHYSPEAELFAYVCYYADIDICTVSSTGENLTNLTPFQSRETDPQWSSTGDKILFVSSQSGIPNIWTMNPDGSELTLLGERTALEGGASWSPDDRLILFETKRDGNSEVYVMDSNGENPKNISDHPGNDYSPKWSPDGDYIAFISDRDGGVDVYLTEKDGTGLVNITGTPQVIERIFIWSLDSSGILFDAPIEEQYEIFMVDIDGENLKNLTNHPADDVDPRFVGY